MLESILQYFNWTALVMASLLVALVVTVVNQTSPGQRVHNAYFALGSAILFAPLFTDWTMWPEHWQSIILQLILTVLVACIIGFNQRQAVVDKFVGNLLEKGGIKKAEGKEGDPGQ